MTATAFAREVLLRPLVFAEPLRLVEPTSWVPHIPFAFWLVDALRPRTILELGTMSGNSYSAFAQSVQNLMLDAACYAVDTWAGDPHAGAYGEDVFQEWSAFHDRHFAAFSRLLRSTFDDAREKFVDGSVDLLHIDGFHTYEAVRHDFESWLPKMSASGVVLLHDINVRERDFGVWRFWEELGHRFPTFGFLHGHGLGVVGVGRSLPGDVRHLLEETSKRHDDTVLTRLLFSRLGTALLWSTAERDRSHLQRELDATASTATAREAELALVRHELASASHDRSSLEQKMSSVEQELAAARQAIADSHAAAAVSVLEVKRVQAELDQERETAARLAREIRQKDATIRERADASEAELARARERTNSQRMRRLTALVQAETDTDRWQRIVLQRSRARATRTLAPVTKALALTREIVRRARHRTLPPIATPLLSSRRADVRRQVDRIKRSGLFDDRYYVRLYPDVVEAAVDPLVHFVLLGAREGRAPHPLFDASFYLEQSSGAGSDNPLLHYLEHGWRCGCDPHPLFDVSFYRERSPDVVAADVEPLAHYLQAGAAALRDPNPLFDSSFYLDHNVDVARSGVNPLVHYLLYGGFEGRHPHPLFDSDYYLQTYDDVEVTGVNPLVHFLKFGAVESRSPNPWFESALYLAADANLRASGENPLLHYLRIGASERRSTSRAFDLPYYVRANPDVATSGLDPLTHYILIGAREGRRVLPPPPGPVPGNLEWSAAAYEKVTTAARVSEASRISELSLAAPHVIRIPESADLVGQASLVALRAEDQPHVSIVIPVLNQLRLTLECLLSIARFTRDIPFEVIVVDNGSSDGTREALCAIPNLVYVRYETNTGFLRACNAGAAEARGRYLVLLNNDAQVTAGWLSALLHAFASGDSVGAVGPKVVYPNGRLQEAGSVIDADCSSRLVGVHDDPALPRFNVPREVDYVSGVCLLLETERFRILGGLSDDFVPAYCEDVDLCLRLRREGLRILYEPTSVIIHHLSATAGDLGTSFKQMAVTSHQQILSEKHQADIDGLDRTRVIAFYLPQFHPIPENDVWWGKGFTEWRNVTRARPNFDGHYQPRLPADLGFYDLRLPATYREQTALARRYGVDGFCIYYYWFGGKRILEGPVSHLAEDESAFPFCVCWANENWTRRWDGLDDEVLLAQSYADADMLAVIGDLIRYLRRPSYIRINGKPLVLVYHAAKFPDARKATALWRDECRTQGIGEVYLAMVESFELSKSVVNPSDWGFDAAVEFPPHHGGIFPAAPGRILNPAFAGRVFDYNKTAANYMTRAIPGYRRFRTVMPGWDNTARRQDDPVIFAESTPGAYQAWLEAALRQTREQNFGDEQLVFVNAWNEWAEGTYLEPDLAWGHGYLEATRNARDNIHLGLYSPLP